MRLRHSARPLFGPNGDPSPLPYLDSAENRAHGGLDIDLEVWLQTAANARCRACRRPVDDVELPRRVLDARAAGRAPHDQRLQPARRRPVRLRHAVGPRAVAGRLTARTDPGRQAADQALQRRDARVSSRTATPSFCAAAASAKASARSASASAAALCCPRVRSAKGRRSKGRTDDIERWTNICFRWGPICRSQSPLQDRIRQFRRRARKAAHSPGADVRLQPVTDGFSDRARLSSVELLRSMFSAVPGPSRCESRFSTQSARP